MDRPPLRAGATTRPEEGRFYLQGLARRSPFRAAAILAPGFGRAPLSAERRLSTVAITRTVRAAGLYRSAPRSVPANVSRITIAIDSDWLAAYDVALFGIEASFDAGVTWQHIASATIYGGARDRNGNPPSLGLVNPAPGLYRLFALLSSAADIGLTVDVV